MKLSSLKWLLPLCLACSLPIIKAQCDPIDSIIFKSHTTGDVVDTSANGLATGSFILRGLAPPGTFFIQILLPEILIPSEDGDLDEIGPADIDEQDECETKWSIEIIGKETRQLRIIVDALLTGSQFASGSITLNVVAPGEDDMLVQPTFAFTPQYHENIVSYDEASGTIVFDTDVTADIKPGSGLASDMTPEAPNGYSRIVVSVETDGFTSTVQTRQAAIYEFARRLKVSYEDSPGSVEITNPDSITTTSPESARRNLLMIGPNTELTFEVNLDPSATFDIDIGWRTPDCWFCIIPLPFVELFQVEAGLDFGLDVGLSHTENFFEREDNFGPKFDDFKFATIRIPTPVGLPIIVTFELDSQPFYKISLTAEFSVSYNPTISLKAGYQYKSDGSGRGAYTEDDVQLGLEQIDTTLEITAVAGVGIEVDIEGLLFGQVGFEIDATPTIQAEATADLIECEVDWELALVVPFEANLAIEIGIGPLTWEEEIGDIELGKLMLPLDSGTIQFDNDVFCPTEPPQTLPPTTPPTEPITTPDTTDTPCPPENVRKDGSCGGDPHFHNFNGEYFGYHGVCDLVLARSQTFGSGLGLEVHIRTQERDGYSSISHAAIRIGSDVFEVVNDGTYFANGVADVSLPHFLAGFYAVTMTTNTESNIFTGDVSHGFTASELEESTIFEVKLGEDEQVEIQRWKDYLWVNIRGGENLQDTSGLMGSMKNPGKIARDGVTIMHDVDEFGQEWQVRSTEPVLFQTLQYPQHPTPCLPSPATIPARRLGQESFAEDACSHVEGARKEFCVYDVLVTGDVAIAQVYNN